MGYENYSLALAFNNLDNHFLHLPGNLGIKSTKGFIQQQQLRALG